MYTRIEIENKGLWGDNPEESCTCRRFSLSFVSSIPLYQISVFAETYSLNLCDLKSKEKTIKTSYYHKYRKVPLVFPGKSFFVISFIDYGSFV